MFGDEIIVPGAHGIGTSGYTPTESGYARAADDLIRLDREGVNIDTSDYNVRRVMDYFGASDLRGLSVQRGSIW